MLKYLVILVALSGCASTKPFATGKCSATVDGAHNVCLPL